MKIVVCFKVEPDYEKILTEDWEQFEILPDTSYVGFRINCFDEAALELALQEKDRNGTVHCTAVTLGELPPVLSRKLYAAGFDQVCRLCCPATISTPRETARRLADFVRSEGADLVWMGCCAAPADSGCVPAYTAWELGWAFLSDVTEFSCGDENIQATQETTDSRAVYQYKGKAVLSVSPSVTLSLRMPMLAAQLRAKQRSVLETEQRPLPKLEWQLVPAKAKICQWLDGDAGQWVDLLEKAREEL